MKLFSLLVLGFCLSATHALASTPRVVATCFSDGSTPHKPTFRVIVTEVFGVPHLGYFPHYYKAEFTEITLASINELGTFAAKYTPQNSNSYQSSQFFKGRNFLLKFFTDRHRRPDGLVPALMEARVADGTDYSQKLLCSLEKLMVF